MGLCEKVEWTVRGWFAGLDLVTELVILWPAIENHFIYVYICDNTILYFIVPKEYFKKMLIHMIWQSAGDSIADESEGEKVWI